MGPPYEAPGFAPVPGAGLHRNGRPRGSQGPVGRALGEAPGGRRCQNLILPIMPAMLVVSSLIVGAMVEEAR